MHTRARRPAREETLIAPRRRAAAAALAGRLSPAARRVAAAPTGRGCRRRPPTLAARRAPRRAACAAEAARARASPRVGAAPSTRRPRPRNDGAPPVRGTARDLELAARRDARPRTRGSRPPLFRLRRRRRRARPDRALRACVRGRRRDARDGGPRSADAARSAAPCWSRSEKQEKRLLSRASLCVVVGLSAMSASAAAPFPAREAATRRQAPADRLRAAGARRRCGTFRKAGALWVAAHRGGAVGRLARGRLRPAARSPGGVFARKRKRTRRRARVGARAVRVFRHAAGVPRRRAGRCARPEAAAGGVHARALRVLRRARAQRGRHAGRARGRGRALGARAPPRARVPRFLLAEDDARVAPVFGAPARGTKEAWAATRGIARMEPTPTDTSRRQHTGSASRDGRRVRRLRVARASSRASPARWTRRRGARGERVASRASLDAAFSERARARRIRETFGTTRRPRRRRPGARE